MLHEYHAKRRFSETPEPEGGAAPAHAGAMRFVVQKHDASRLHYDFRLELDGVLKSWAVPKGPSQDPRDRRLAIQVEDHPLEYRRFEGIIPEGNYGAGTVMVWDEGTYHPAGDHSSRAQEEKVLRDGLARGRLSIELHGRKLRGQFALVRMNKGKANEWLLLKRDDADATTADVLAKDRSVVSRRGLTGIKAHAEKHGHVWQSNRAAAAAPKRRVRPMLATATDEPFDRPGWLFEIKWDGYRAIADVANGEVALYSRTGQPFNSKYPDVVQALTGLDHDVILDGEVVALDEQGRPSFQLLQNYTKTGEGQLAYCVFDLLELDGKDLRNQPLIRRKERLRDILPERPALILGEHVAEDGIGLLQVAAAKGLEGIMAKRADSTYQEGRRSHDWLKIKLRRRQEAVIGGFTRPRGARKKFGALVLGVYDGKELVYVGHTGGGFDEHSLGEVHAALAPLVRPSCPFKHRPKTNTPATWVEPSLVCEVTFQDWTADGIMRQPIFLGLRGDKPAASVRRERPAKTRVVLAAAANARAQDLVQGSVTNPGKVYWPDEGYTKADLIAYYRAVAPLLLPHLRDRPLSLHRHPDGIAGQSFFQKDVSKQPPPPWITTAPITSTVDGKVRKQVLCQDEATLVYLANLGCIEVNPWTSRVGSLDRPDYLVIDLDPHEAPFSLAVAAAREVRKLLQRHCAECFCKTSGKRGLHVYVPLAARYDFDQARQFAEIIARLLEQKFPDTVSLVRDPKLRKGKLYVDYLQNRQGQTTAAAYSVRPVTGATVSTPLRWSELTGRLDPRKFTIRTVPRRLDRLGDLWAAVLGAGADLERCVAGLSA